MLRPLVLSHVIWTGGIWWWLTHENSEGGKLCFYPCKTPNFWTLHVVSNAGCIFPLVFPVKCSGPGKIGLWHTQKMPGSMGLRCREELRGQDSGIDNYMGVSSGLSSSSPPLLLPVLLWVPLTLCLWATFMSPSHIPPSPPILFTIMRCWRAWWQIGYEALLSKWPTTSFERSQFSECFFPAGSALISPEVSVNIPKCMCRQER